MQCGWCEVSLCAGCRLGQVSEYPRRKRCYDVAAAVGLWLMRCVHVHRLMFSYARLELGILSSTSFVMSAAVWQGSVVERMSWFSR
jgi:hypothetical protein